MCGDTSSLWHLTIDTRPGSRAFLGCLGLTGSRRWLPLLAPSLSVQPRLSVSVSPLLPSCPGLASLAWAASLQYIQMSSRTRQAATGPSLHQPMPSTQTKLLPVNSGRKRANLDVCTDLASRLFICDESLNKSVCVRVELFVTVWRETVLCGWICEGISRAEWGHESYRYIKSFQNLNHCRIEFFCGVTFKIVQRLLFIIYSFPWFQIL